MNWVTLAIIAIVTGAAFYYYKHSRQARQLEFIKSYHFHHAIKEKILSKHPHLDNNQIHMVFRALRDYFWMCNKGNRSMVAMPSQVVDDAWHEFILFTRSYEHFCKKSLGRFLHHTPTEMMSSPTVAQEGIKRAWRLACAKEHIDPKTPAKLPLIFAIDGLLNIENGFKYSLNCRDKHSPNYGDGYCAGHIGCSSGCAGNSGSSSDSGEFFDSSCGSSCGSGCGGGD